MTNSSMITYRNFYATQRKSSPTAGLAILSCIAEGIDLHFAAAVRRRRRSGAAGVM